jgi:hypothetical protein
MAPDSNLLGCVREERGAITFSDGGGEKFPVTVTLSQREIILAALIGGFMGARAIARRYKQHYNNDYGFWGSAIEGIAAEIAVAKALGIPYRPNLEGFKAPDVGELHVRQTAHRDGSLIIRPGDPDGVYVLAIGQCPVFRIVGWIHSYDAKQPQYWRAPNGGPGAWFVPQRMLKPLAALRTERTCSPDKRPL